MCQFRLLLFLGGITLTRTQNSLGVFTLFSGDGGREEWEERESGREGEEGRGGEGRGWSKRKV